MKLNTIKFIFLSLLAISSSYAINYEENFMIDNQSSCNLTFHSGINKTFTPNSPDMIKPFTQTPIKYIINDDSIMNKSLVRYNIHCNSSYFSSTSGYIEVYTKLFSDHYSISKSATSFDPKLKLKIDNNGTIIISYQ